MNLKNWTAHFFMRFDFLFLDEQNNLYSQSYNITENFLFRIS